MPNATPKQINHDNHAWSVEAKAMNEDANSWKAEQARALADLGAFVKQWNDLAAESDKHAARVEAEVAALAASPTGKRHDEAGAELHDLRKQHAELRRRQHDLMGRYNSLSKAVTALP